MSDAPRSLPVNVETKKNKKTKTNPKQIEFKQTDTYVTQCSSSSCGEVLTAERCFWQVNGGSRLTGRWVKQGLTHFKVQQQGMWVYFASV